MYEKEVVKHSKIIYLLGTKFRIIRYLYWRLSKHRYLWGIRNFLRDNYIANPKSYILKDLKTSEDWLDKHLEEIFKSKQTKGGDKTVNTTNH